MSVELIGLIIFGLSAASLLHSTRMAFLVMCCAALLQAAAALFIGTAQLVPGQLAAAFFILAIAIRQGGLAAMMKVITPMQTGFILLALTFWGVFSAIVLPAVFQGSFDVYPLTNPNMLAALVEYPVGPNPSNLNHSFYAVMNLVTFVAVAAMARTTNAVLAGAYAIVFASALNLVLAFLDVATHAVGMASALDIIRNAEYAQHFTQTIMGMKRISGSYPEPSVFATMSVGLFAFCLRLWRGGVLSSLSGPIAAGTLFAIIMCTSSTGYVALAAYLAVVYGMAMARMDSGSVRRSLFTSRRALFISFGPMAALVGVMLVAFRPDLLTPVTDIFDASLTTKLQSDSGEERMRWNMSGLQNIIDSYGMGTGLGTIRTSSFIIGVPAQLGLFGTLLFAVFFVRIFSAPKIKPQTIEMDRALQVAAAARSSCFAFLLAACVSSGVLDLGLIFYSAAGLACGLLFSAPQQRPAYVPPPEGAWSDGGPPVPAGVANRT